ncbi:MAG: ABC transporter ATP-binding protein, partial [Myxococcota bacterium]
MASIRLEALRKVYPGGALALAGLDLEVTDGELLVLVGPSGCGKSTALRLVAGLEDATEGRVWLAGRDVTGLGPGERDLAMVFQSYALYPHKTVAENLAFPLRMRRRPRSEIERRVGETAAVLGLSELLGRRPRELSGGERQRVALGRAMVREPAAFLLDEPLSNLDARLRVEMRAELARLHRRLGATMILVTHDQEEAMILGGRIAVLRKGRMEQLGTPEALYARPDTLFVARFLGAPA